MAEAWPSTVVQRVKRFRLRAVSFCASLRFAAIAAVLGPLVIPGH